jgi:hypothetical protein
MLFKLIQFDVDRVNFFWDHTVINNQHAALFKDSRLLNLFANIIDSDPASPNKAFPPAILPASTLPITIWPAPIIL